MDNVVNRYCNAAKRIVLQHAEYAPSRGEIETRPIIDDAQNNYLLVDSGWDRTGRVHAVILDLRIKEGKVWIEVDGTEEGVAYELAKAGIPQEDIVLGFFTPRQRALVEFAPA